MGRCRSGCCVCARPDRIGWPGGRTTGPWRVARECDRAVSDRVTLVLLARLDDADLERLVDERAPRTAPATTAALASSPTASDYRAATPTKPGRHAAHSPRAFWKAAAPRSARPLRARPRGRAPSPRRGPSRHPHEPQQPGTMRRLRRPRSVMKVCSIIIERGDCPPEGGLAGLLGFRGSGVQTGHRRPP